MPRCAYDLGGSMPYGFSSQCCLESGHEGPHVFHSAAGLFAEEALPTPDTPPKVLAFEVEPDASMNWSNRR